MMINLYLKIRINEHRFNLRDCLCYLAHVADIHNINHDIHWLVQKVTPQTSTFAAHLSHLQCLFDFK